MGLKAAYKPIGFTQNMQRNNSGQRFYF